MKEPFSADQISDIVHKYSQTVVKAAFAYVKNTSDAEDIAQDVFLILLQKSPSFSNNDHLKAWLIRVAINRSKNHLKSGWFRKNDPLPDNLVYMPQEKSELLHIVLSLNAKYRIPIHLFYYEGYSIQEIADILQMRPATVGTRLARGRQLLKNQIGGLDDENERL